ncbi:MAG TPA: hypothetical protein VHJ20_21755 [Polyangia bacterium]|nr:hypothetical protein [Polyangia bacterium]
MNLANARVVLRPRTLADVVDLALPFALAGRRPLFATAALTLGPVAALVALLRLWAHWRWPALWLVVLGAWWFLDGACTVVVGELLFKDPREVRARASVRRFFGRWPALVTAISLRAIVLGLAGSLVVLPLFVAPGTQFLREAMLLENAKMGRAWTRSRSLARHRGSFCFGLWLATILLPPLGALLGDGLGNSVVAFVLQLGFPFGELFKDGGSGFAVAGALLAMPIAASARFLGYVDLRTRKEGWDVQLRFMHLVAESATSGARVNAGRRVA